MSGEEQKRGFWNRRKAAVREAEAREEAERLAALEAQTAAELEEKTDEEILEELGLPDPEELKEGDDFKAFLAAAVPERLRRKALRRLWITNPALANLDGLIEYGEDYTDAATVVENLQTTYQVGKGMLEHIKKLARDAELAAAKEAGEELPEGDPGVESAAETEDQVASAGEEEAGTYHNSDGSIQFSNGNQPHEALTIRQDSVQADAEYAAHAESVQNQEGDFGHELPPRRRMRFTFG